MSRITGDKANPEMCDNINTKRLNIYLLKVVGHIYSYNYVMGVFSPKIAPQVSNPSYLANVLERLFDFVFKDP